jgi:hypothetical protein
MMPLTQQIQQELFEKMLTQYSGSKNQLVLELSDVMAISKDGVYRRWRGDTLLTLEDLQKLTKQYRISVDTLLNSSPTHFMTEYNSNLDFDLEKFLNDLKQRLQFLLSLEVPTQIYFNAKELPIFYLFFSPELLAFKSFFWQNTFCNDSIEDIGTFQLDSLSETCTQLSQEVYDLYNSVESIELWSQEIFSATLKQIKYYYDTDVVNQADALHLLDCVENLTQILEQFTSAGMKGNNGKDKASVTIYFNEVLIGNNTVIVKNEHALQTYISENILTTIVVDQKDFCRHSFDTFLNITKKSTIISGTSEKNRKKFFRNIKAEIERYRNKIKY